MTKNLDRIKIRAFLTTLKEQYPEHFEVEAEEFLAETKTLSQAKNTEKNEKLDFFIQKNFERYAEVFKALA